MADELLLEWAILYVGLIGAACLLRLGLILLLHFRNTPMRDVSGMHYDRKRNMLVLTQARRIDWPEWNRRAGGDHG